MELPIYDNLDDFKEYYLDDFSSFLNVSFLQFLTIAKKKYDFELQVIGSENTKELETLYLSYSDFYKVYLKKVNSQSYHFEDFLDTEIESQIFDNEIENKKFEFDPYYICLHSNLFYNDENINLLKTYSEIYLEKKEIDKKFSVLKKNINQILDFIKILSDNEKIFVLRGTPQPPQDEPEPLTAKQQQKVGLLIRSGLVNFLREKNPKISKNQISGFIELLTAEPMKKTSINTHLVDNTDNVKHPFYSHNSLDEIDLKLKQLGISPQADK